MFRVQRILIILVALLSQFPWAQDEPNRDTTILVFSQEDGYNWNALQEEENVIRHLRGNFRSCLVDPLAPIISLSRELREPYASLIAMHIKAPIKTSKPNSRLLNSDVDLATQLVCDKLFYHIRLVIESSEPLAKVKLQSPEQSYEMEDYERKYPYSKLKLNKTVQSLEKGLNFSWQYTAEWEDILLDVQTTEIACYFYFDSAKSPELHTIPLFNNKNSAILEQSISLSPTSFMLPSVLLKTENNKPGAILGMQLIEGKNRNLYSMLVNAEWKNVKFTRDWTKDDFLSDYFGKESFSGVRKNNIIPLVHSQPKLPASHFLAFRTRVTYHQDFISERNSTILTFKDNIIVLNFDYFNSGVPRIALPNIVFDQKMACWIKYPANSEKWREIIPEVKNGKYYFKEDFDPAGDPYFHMATQTRKKRSVYRGAMIGNKIEQIEEKVQPNPDEWGVPWKEKSYFNE